jgi:hypothetical protein
MRRDYAGDSPVCIEVVSFSSLFTGLVFRQCAAPGTFAFLGVELSGGSHYLFHVVFAYQCGLADGHRAPKNETLSPQDPQRVPKHILIDAPCGAREILFGVDILFCIL